MNATSFFTTRFKNIFAKILALPTDELELQYNESSGEFLIVTRSLSSAKKNETLEKMKNPTFRDSIQNEIIEDEQLKELNLQVEKSSEPSIIPVLSKWINSTWNWLDSKIDNQIGKD